MSWTSNSPADLARGAALLLSASTLACGHAAAAPRVRIRGGGDDPVFAALVSAPSGNTLVRCAPPDAELDVDGVPRGFASDYDGRKRLLALAPGRHQITLAHAGFAPVAIDVTVSADGGRQTLDAVLPPLRRAANP